MRLVGVIVTLTVVSVVQPLVAQDSAPSGSSTESPNSESIYSDVPQFGGPSSVGGQIAEDASLAPRFRFQGLQDHFQPWFDFKQRVNESCGLQFNIDESILYQAATNSAGESDAASGLVRVYGQLELIGRDSGSPGMLVFKAEDRHRIATPITPFDLGFDAGSILPTGTFFSEFDFSVTNLFWKQYFFDRQLAIAVGRIDVTDFVDVYGMINPLTHFLNLAFSTSPTIAAPNQGLGVAAGGMLTDHFYMQGGFSDANGQPTQAGFDTFFDDAEFFSYAELGVTTSQDMLYLDNVHVTFWHSDARERAGSPEGRGVAFTAQKFLGEKWLPFFRCGYSDGDAALMETSCSTGIGLLRENRDVAGVGVSWGRPATPGLREQFTSELFYRFQLTQFLAVTPDVQLIGNPALNPDEELLAMFGIRLRAAF